MRSFFIGSLKNYFLIKNKGGEKIDKKRKRKKKSKKTRNKNKKTKRKNKEEKFMAKIKKEDGKTAPQRCLYCGEEIIITKKGTGIFCEVKKRCPTNGCPYNNPTNSIDPSSGQRGWGN